MLCLKLKRILNYKNDNDNLHIEQEKKLLPCRQMFITPWVFFPHYCCKTTGNSSHPLPVEFSLIFGISFI